MGQRRDKITRVHVTGPLPRSGESCRRGGSLLQDSWRVHRGTSGWKSSPLVTGRTTESLGEAKSHSVLRTPSYIPAGGFCCFETTVSRCSLFSPLIHFVPSRRSRLGLPKASSHGMQAPLRWTELSAHCDKSFFPITEIINNPGLPPTHLRLCLPSA